MELDCVKTLTDVYFKYIVEHSINASYAMEEIHGAMTEYFDGGNVSDISLGNVITIHCIIDNGDSGYIEHLIVIKSELNPNFSDNEEFWIKVFHGNCSLGTIETYLETYSISEK